MNDIVIETGVAPAADAPVQPEAATPTKQKAAKSKARKLDDLIAKLNEQEGVEYKLGESLAVFATTAEMDGDAADLAIVKLQATEATEQHGSGGVPWGINGRYFVLKPEVWYVVPRFLRDHIKGHRAFNERDTTNEAGVKQVVGTVQRVQYPMESVVL